MIGLGKWSGNVKTMFFQGNVYFTIGEKDGEYTFDMELPKEMENIPKFNIESVKENGNTLEAKATISLLPGKTVDAVLNFDGDIMNGNIKLPFIGKIDLKDFKKVQF